MAARSLQEPKSMSRLVPVSKSTSMQELMSFSILELMLTLMSVPKLVSMLVIPILLRTSLKP